MFNNLRTLDVSTESEKTKRYKFTLHRNFSIDEILDSLEPGNQQPPTP